MQVYLAGYNVDNEILSRLGGKEESILSPETLSAAYARISRSPKGIPELRREAVVDVKKARKSNRNIIFEMGHHSVAEHAVFNFDIMDVSRLTLEEIEQFRLVSYTEKSQRYVTLEGDFVLPEEIESESDRRAFKNLILEMNRFYQDHLPALYQRQHSLHPHMEKNASQKRTLEGWAKEDARYCLPLATAGQVGLTINARNLEHLFRRFSLSPLAETRTLSKAIFELVFPVAPSLILFPEPSRFESDSRQWGEKISASCHSGDPASIKKSEIIDFTPGGDDRILAAFLFLNEGIDLLNAEEKIRSLSPSQKRELFLRFFEPMEFFDRPPRAFEFAEITFQAVVSSACFAQLKRHRPATLLPGPYDPLLGVTIPASFREMGMESSFLELMGKAEQMQARFMPSYGRAADYILANAHRRSVLMKMNMREMYHFIRLRDDDHAQWDIRELAAGLLTQVKERFPLASLLLCGKSGFSAEYEKLFGHSPRIPVPS